MTLLIRWIDRQSETFLRWLWALAIIVAVGALPVVLFQSSLALLGAKLWGLLWVVLFGWRGAVRFSRARNLRGN